MADGKIIIDTAIDNSGAEKDIKGLDNKLGSMASGALGTIAKVTAGMVAVASGAVAALATLSIKQFAEYEQLVGGVDTLFKENSMTIQGYADDAFRTAGMSANEYMSTVTGFSASLLQGLGGDTAKAAEIGNKAVIDMSDNANKMGTGIENIQNAYQGFAKQNYTMLDNLKLGYGGTKTEMERLLKDAEKLSGQKYDIGNFSDVIEGIHVVQTELGITGTTALEASTTIEGSFNTMKSAWSNMLRVFADDSADFEFHMDNLLSSIGTFGENILPRVKIILEGIGLFANEIAQKLPGVIMEILPGVIDAGINVLGSFVSSIMDALPQLITLGGDVIKTLLTGIQNSFSGVSSTAFDTIMLLVQELYFLLPQILQTGIDIILELISGLSETLPELVPIAINAILTLINVLLNNFDKIFDTGWKLLMALGEGLIAAIPLLVERVPTIINKLLNIFASNFPKMIGMGLELIAKLAVGLIKAIPSLLMAVPKLIGGLISAFANYYSGFGDVGKNIVTGIWNGISGAAGWLMSKISGFADSIVGGIKGFFGIHSPSRVMRDLIGTNIVKGIGVGVDLETPNLEKDIDANMSDLVSKMKGTIDYETAMTTARVVAHNNSLSGGVESESAISKENPITVVAKFIVDGKEFTQTVIAPNQDVLNEYYEGR